MKTAHVANNHFHDPWCASCESVIKLTDNNYIRGKLPDGYLNIIVDSGASITLIGSNIIEESAYLRSCPVLKGEGFNIRIADGKSIHTDRYIEFSVELQGVKVNLSAYIVKPIGVVDCLLGCPELQRLHANIDFRTGTLRLKVPKTVAFTAVSNTSLKPGQTRIVMLAGKLPAVFKRCDMILKMNEFGKKISSHSVLVRCRKKHCYISVLNNTDHVIKIKQGRVLAHADFCSTKLPWEPVVNIDIKQDETVFLTEVVSHEMDRKSLYQHKKQRYPFLSHDDSKLSKTDREIIDEEVDLKNKFCILNKPERERFQKLLYSCSDVFSLHGEVGSCDYEVTLNLTDDTPFYIRPYSVSEKEKKIIDFELDKLVKMNVLRQGVTSSSSPVMLIDKKGQPGSKRLVTDFRYLNQRIRKQNWPFPLVKDSIQKIGHSDCTIISTIDLKEAYHSLKLEKNSQRFCGITSYSGGRSYFYTRLPQGASISPSEFQMFIEKVLDDIPNSRENMIAHMDDTIIFSKDMDSHFVHLENLFHGLMKHGLKISPKKSKFFRRELEYMGHNISIQNGRPCISPVLSKCDAIRRIGIPKTVSAVKSFIGAVNYLSMYLPRLHELLKPMYELTKKSVVFKWTPIHQDVFERIKEMLVKPPVLNMPVSSGLIKLYSDTSSIATGGTLCQIIDGQEKIIAYYSKSLPASAKRYSVSELELTGLYLNCVAFRNILKQTHFMAIVDHSALVQIMSSKREPPTMRLKKLVEKLSDYTFDLVYQKGDSLVVCDLLSRMCENIAEPELKIEQVACPVTRSQAKAQGIEVGSIQENKEILESTRGRRSHVSTQNVVPEVSETEHVESESIETIEVNTEGDVPEVERHQSDVTESVDLPQGDLPRFQEDLPFNPIPEPPKPQSRSQRLIDLELSKKGSRGKIEIPFDSQIPRNQPNVQADVEEHFSPPDDLVFRKHKPLFENITDTQIKHGHLPKQFEIDRLLEQIKMKCLRDLNVPFKIAEIKREMKLSPYFKNIYEYLLTGLLPSNKKMAKSVMKSSENYILIQEVLFRITNDKSEIKIALCVPETQSDYIISTYHDSLLSCHQGVNKTFVTIRRKFYIPNLFDRLSAFIRSCTICQQRKIPQSRDKEKPYNPRIFQNYSPFSEIHIDMKSMFPSTEGFVYLMVCMCVQTRFIMAFPLRRIDAVSVAETLLQKIVLLFGVPQRIVTDQGKSFTNQVFSYLLRTLKIQPILVSPENHGSLVVERGIQSLSRLLLSNLEGHGRNWPLYVQATCFAYNSFAHTLLRGFSPFELVFLREPPDFLSLKFLPNDTLPVTYEQYVSRLKQRMSIVGKTLLDLQAKQQLSQAKEHVQSLRKKTTYTVGQLVYFLMPSLSNLQTNTRAFKVHYIGPLRIKTVLDETRVILEDLTGRVLSGVHHVHRLKPAFVRVHDGVVENFKSLGRKVLEKNSDEMVTLVFVDENDKVKDPVNVSQFVLFASEENESCSELMSKQFYKNNGGLACNDKVSETRKAKLVKRLEKMPVECSDLLITKTRYKNGELQCLFTQNDYSFWIQGSLHPNLGLFQYSCVHENVVQGSILKWLRKIYVS